RRLGRMPCAAPDFRIFWDNAYAIDHLTEERIEIANILDLCTAAGQPDRALVFSSTSKVTFPGAGLAVFASSEKNLQWFLAHAGKRSIGPDKINQPRHVAALPNADALHELMDQHRQLLAPKFQAVRAIFEQQFD